MNKQYNYITGKDYYGRNQVELLNEKSKNDFNNDAWITFIQARNKGLKIKKGSHGVGIFKGFEKFEEKDAKGQLKVVSRPLGFAKVFNLDQTEKL